MINLVYFKISKSMLFAMRIKYKNIIFKFLMGFSSITKFVYEYILYKQIPHL
jgi:hypothetical protein